MGYASNVYAGTHICSTEVGLFINEKVVWIFAAS